MPIYNMFSQLKYSDEQKAILSKYHQLASQPSLNLEEIYEVGLIWQHAAKDQKLCQALSFIDDVQARALNEPLLSEDKNLRAYLSEYVPAHAADQLSYERREREELTIGDLHISHICPDGSAITTISDGQYVRLEELDDEVCNVCNKKFSEHQRVISPGGTPVSLGRH